MRTLSKSQKIPFTKSDCSPPCLTFDGSLFGLHKQVDVAILISQLPQTLLHSVGESAGGTGGHQAGQD